MTWLSMMSFRNETPSSRQGLRQATAAALTAAVASGRPVIEPLRSTSRQIAVAGSRPRPDPQVVGVDGILGSAWAVDERVEAGIDIEIATIGSVPLGPELSDAVGTAGPRREEVEEESAGEAARQFPQFRVGRTG